MVLLMGVGVGNKKSLGTRAGVGAQWGFSGVLHRQWEPKGT